MEFKEIQDILKLVNKTDLTEVEIEKKDFKLTIRRKQPESNVIYTATQQASLPPATVSSMTPPVAPVTTASAPAAETAVPAKETKASASENENLYTFKSPMIGTFYRSPSPDSDPFVKVGDQIEKGQVLCIIEAMKLFNEIESEVAGKIVKVMLDNAQPVEYDQPLFIIEPNG